MKEWIQNFLNYKQDLFGLLLPEAVFYAVVGILLLSILYQSYRSFVPKKKDVDAVDLMDTIKRTCANCQWEGELSKHARKCPRCGSDNFVY